MKSKLGNLNMSFKMYKPLLMSLSLIGLLSACSDQATDQSPAGEQPNKSQNASAQNTVENDAQEQRLNTNQLTEEKLSETKLEAIERKQAIAEKLNLAGKPSQSKQLTFNKEKFKLLSPVAKKGAKVFNLSNNEYGTMKGSVVVVSESKSAFNATVFSQAKIQEIAKDTYRLTIDSQNDLMTFYQSLIKMAVFKVVEMEIDYSPILLEE